MSNEQGNSLRRSGRKRNKPAYFEAGCNETEILKATKLSLDLQRRVVHNIPDAPCFTPTHEEFEDFLQYMDKLKEIGKQCGIVKIKVPSGWWTWKGVKLRKSMITKRQRLHCLTQAKPFGDGLKYSYETYREYADKFQRDYFDTHPHFKQQIQQIAKEQGISSEQASIKLIEQEYWNIVERVNDEQVTVDYANDLGVNRYGSGFEQCQNSWNLTTLVDCDRSLLKCLGEKCSGMTIPWLYFGALFTTFCWHTEDHYLYSINYMHTGAVKTWYGVPQENALKFERIVKETIPSQFAKNPDLLHHITAMVSPSYLVERGIKVVRCLQNPGELVVTFPLAYHGGFSHGWNCAEAVNFALPDWLPFGSQAVQRYRLGLSKRASVFSHDRVVWLLCQRALKGQSVVDLSRESDRQVISQEMRKVYLQEVRLRKWLVEQEKLPSINLETSDRTSSKPQLCSWCQTEPFLSYTSCSCSQDVIRCLEHTFEGCECDPDKPSRTLYVRISRDQLDTIMCRLDNFVDGSIDPQGQIQIRKKQKLAPTNIRFESDQKSFQIPGCVASTKVVLKRAKTEEQWKTSQSVDGIDFISVGECKSS